MQQRETWLLKSWFCKWKCSATGDLWNLRFVQSERWPFMRSLRARFVSPTYCLHIGCTWLGRWHLQIDLAIWVGVISLHVKHLLLPQGFDSPVGPSSLGSGLSFAWTRISLRLFGLLYAIMGFWGKLLFKRFEDSMIGQCLLTISLTLGSSGWYVSTKGINVPDGSGYGL